jgi:integrase/recombinase XerD
MDATQALVAVDGTLSPNTDTGTVHTDTVLIDAWLHGKPNDTTRAYGREVAQLLAHARRPLQEISIFDLQAYDRDRLMNLADASRKRAIAAIRSIFKFLLASGLIQVNPSALMQAPKVSEELADRYLTPDQVQAIINAAKTPRDRAMLELLYYGGLRVSELVSLQWSDVKVTDTGATLRIMGKGHKVRKVMIDADMLTVLQAQAIDGNPFVFVSRTGKQAMTTRAAFNIVADAGNACVLDISPHFFRHSHASHVLASGINIADVRDELGHANIATTNKYVHGTSSKPLGSVLRRKVAEN